MIISIGIYVIAIVIAIAIMMRRTTRIFVIILAYVGVIYFVADVYRMIYQCGKHPSNATITNVQYVSTASIVRVDVALDDYMNCTFFDYDNPRLHINGRCVITSVDNGVCNVSAEPGCYYSKKVIMGAFVINTIFVVVALKQIVNAFEDIYDGKYWEELPL